MRSIAIYARVSSEQQAQEATIDSQVAALKERVAADGHVLLPQDVYLDDGFSGSTLVRPALERLRDRVAEGGVDRLYVHSPDRLARKYAYQVLLLDELRKQGVTTVFLNGPSGKTAEDELLVQVQGMIAEYERAKILERSRRGKIHRARHGEISPLGCAPYGFAYVKKRDGEPVRDNLRTLLSEEERGVHALENWPRYHGRGGGRVRSSVLFAVEALRARRHRVPARRARIDGRDQRRRSDQTEKETDTLRDEYPVRVHVSSSPFGPVRDAPPRSPRVAAQRMAGVEDARRSPPRHGTRFANPRTAESESQLAARDAGAAPLKSAAISWVVAWVAAVVGSGARTGRADCPGEACPSAGVPRAALRL